MTKKTIFAVLLYCTSMQGGQPLHYTPQIHALFTTAVPHGNKEREEQYREAFTLVRQYAHQFPALKNPYIIEAIQKKKPSCPQDFTCEEFTSPEHIFYAGDHNNSTWKNRALNEGVTVAAGLHHFSFNPDDIVAKFTGRYTWEKPSENDPLFFETVTKNAHNFDAIVALSKKDYSGSYGYGKDKVLLIATAMKAGLMIKMYESFNYNELEETKTPLEHAVTEWIDDAQQTRQLKVLTVNKLNIGVNTVGSLTRNTIGTNAGQQTADWKEIF